MHMSGFGKGLILFRCTVYQKLWNAYKLLLQGSQSLGDQIQLELTY